MEKQLLNQLHQDPESFVFWRKKYNSIPSLPLTTYEKVESVEKLEKLYKDYRKRIFQKNSYPIIWFISKLSIFPINIKIF